MKVARIPLRPYTRFHFGELKLDHDLALTDTSMFAHSDTLFSALVHAYAAYAEDATDFVEKFQQEQIKISSLFYFLQSSNEIVYFLPKPVFLAITSQKTEDGNHKKRNRIEFVSTNVWKQNFDADNWFDETKFKILQDKFVLTKVEYDKLFPLFAQTDENNEQEKEANDFSISKIVHSPKSPKRAHRDAAIYYQADVEIGGDEDVTVGWYFLYEAEAENETALKIATNIMAYTGIGGEIKNTGRTISHQPTLEPFDFSLTNEDHLKYINLSLFSPKEEDDFKQVLYYSTSLRGGRRLSLEGKQFTNVVRMINEGALITSNHTKGKLVELGDDEQGRKILRNGIPFLIPVNYDENT